MNKGHRKAFGPGDVLKVHNDLQNKDLNVVVLSSVKYGNQRAYAVYQILDEQSESDARYSTGGVYLPNFQAKLFKPYPFSIADQHVVEKIGEIKRSAFSTIRDVLSSSLAWKTKAEFQKDIQSHSSTILPGEIVYRRSQYPDKYGSKDVEKVRPNIVVSSEAYHQLTGQVIYRMLTCNLVAYSCKEDVALHTWQNSHGREITQRVGRTRPHIQSAAVESFERQNLFLKPDGFSRVMYSTRRFLKVDRKPAKDYIELSRELKRSRALQLKAQRQATTEKITVPAL